MVKVAVSQIRVTDNISKNLEKILFYIGKAKSNKADIVCFGETSLNTNDRKNIDISKELADIQKKCRENLIYCIFVIDLSN